MDPFADITVESVNSLKSSDPFADITVDSLNGTKKSNVIIDYVKKVGSEMLSTVSSAKKDIGILNPINAAKDVYSTVKSAYDSASQMAYKAGSELADPNVGKIQAATDVGRAVIAGTGTAFSPVTALLEAGAKIPALGYVADAINSGFAAIGKGGEVVSKDTFNQIPDSVLSKETKKTLEPLVGEVGALGAQILSGKFTGDLLQSKTKELQTKTEKIKQAVSQEAPKEVVPQPKAVDQYPVGSAEIIKNRINNGPISEVDAQKLKGLGVDELPFNPDGTITVYRTSTEPPTPGKTQGYSLNPTVDQTPYQIPKDAVIANLNSKVVDEIYARDFASLSKDIQESYKKGLDTARGLESEILIKTPETSVQNRGLAQGVQEKAVERGITESLGDLPQYDVINRKEQVQRAVDLVNTDYDTARKIAMGDATPPQGIFPESLFVAVEEAALRKGDVATLRDLVNSNLVREGTTMGQRISMLAERNSSSPVAAMKDVVAYRTKASGVKDPVKAKTAELKKVKEEINKVATKKQTWEDFVKEITC